MRSCSLFALAGPIAGVLVLTGCSTADNSDDFDRSPQQVNTDLDAADASDLQLPLITEPLELVEPEWNLPVAHLGGVFVSAQTREKRLNFSAVDIHGTILWKAQRPVGCTGFTVTVDNEDAPLAVLTDSTSTNDCDDEVTASAYDLETGEHKWGPVDVPGPLIGPGTVFAADGAHPAETIALDPADGLAIDKTSDDQRYLGEYRGTILSIDGDVLRATDGDQESWEIPLPGKGWSADELRAYPGEDVIESVIHLDAGDGSGPLLDQETGEILDDDAREVARDANTGAVVTRGEHGVSIIDESGKSDLPVSVSKSSNLDASVGGLIYLRDGRTLRVHNAATGSLARGYPANGSGIVAVPDSFTAEGLGTMKAGDRTLLATDRVVDDSGDSASGQIGAGSREVSGAGGG